MMRNKRRRLNKEYFDSNEIVQIKSDEKLLEKLKAGHGDVKKMRGDFMPGFRFAAMKGFYADQK